MIRRVITQLVTERFDLRRLEIEKDPDLAYTYTAKGNLVALEANIRRYVTGIDAPGLNLDAGREWWWNLPFGPNLVWMVGSVAFAGVVFLAIREIASVQTAVGASLGPDGAAHE